VKKYLELLMRLTDRLPIAFLSPFMPVFPKTLHGFFVVEEDEAPCSKWTPLGVAITGSSLDERCVSMRIVRVEGRVG
jgi:hypothetical protein